MNKATEARTARAVKEENRVLRRRLSAATDKQLLLLNRLIEAHDALGALVEAARSGTNVAAAIEAAQNVLERKA